MSQSQKCDNYHKKKHKHRRCSYSSSSSSDDEKSIKINIDCSNGGGAGNYDQEQECRNKLLKMLLFPQCCRGPPGPQGPQGLQGNVGPQGPMGPSGFTYITGIISPCDGSQPTTQSGDNFTANHFIDNGTHKWQFSFNSNANIKNMFLTAINGTSNNSVQIDAGSVIQANGNISAYIQSPVIVSIKTPLEGFSFLTIF